MEYGAVSIVVEYRQWRHMWSISVPLSRRSVTSDIFAESRAISMTSSGTCRVILHTRRAAVAHVQAHLQEPRTVASDETTTKSKKQHALSNTLECSSKLIGCSTPVEQTYQCQLRMKCSAGCMLIYALDDDVIAPRPSLGHPWWAEYKHGI